MNTDYKIKVDSKTDKDMIVSGSYSNEEGTFIVRKKYELVPDEDAIHCMQNYIQDIVENSKEPHPASKIGELLEHRQLKNE